jgi:hypothetical protein
MGLKATRLGWVSTGTGGGTAEGAGVAGGGLAGGGGVVGGDSGAGAMMRPILSLPWDHGGMVEKVERSGYRIVRLYDECHASGLAILAHLRYCTNADVYITERW